MVSRGIISIHIIYINIQHMYVNSFYCTNLYVCKNVNYPFFIHMPSYDHTISSKSPRLVAWSDKETQ